jgi:lipopolysaccharide export system permease protein
VKIINRYVLREHLGPLLFALTALTSLLLLNYIAKRFGQLVGKGLEWGVIAEFFFLSIPFTVAMTIPMAVLVSVLYAFSRLAAENEITAFKASGVSVRRLLAPVLGAATVLAVLMVGFNDQVLPRSNYRLSILQGDIFRKKPTLALREQVINRVSDRLWIRAGRIHQGERMHDVVIYNFSNPERPSTVFADSGTLRMTADQRDLALELFTGSVEEFPRNEPGRVQRTRFGRNRVVVRDVGNQLERSDGSQAGKGDREMTICEMQARYDSTATEYAVLNRRLDSLAAHARKLGERVTLPRRSTTYSEHGLGALYCRLQETLGVPTAFAATVQDAAGRAPANLRSPVADRPPPPPSTSGVTAIIDAIALQAELNRDVLNTFDVEIQKKFALAVACVIFVLLGAPIALRFPRGGVGLVIGVSLGVFATYYVCLIAGETVADKGYLPPWAAMWAANVIFGAVGLVLLARMGREGATARGGDMGELLENARMQLARLGRRVGVPAERRRHG